MAKVRSPNYPSMSLPDAIEAVRKIYEKDHRNRMAKAVVAQHLGYSSLNGASLTAISAVAKYGLLDRSGEEYRVSDNALTILVDPPESTERAEALRAAALQPPLFAEIHRHYQGSVPSEDNLRAYLQKREFTAAAASAASRAYRDTMALVSTGSSAYNGEAMETSSTGAVVTARGVGTARSSGSATPTVTSSASGTEREWQRFNLTPGRNIRLLFSANDEPTRREVDKLIRYLEITKEDLLPDSEGASAA